MNAMQRIGAMKEFELFLSSRFEFWEKEKQFAKGRKWRADYFIEEAKTIIEINGGQWTGGRHTTSRKNKGQIQTGYEKDLEKSNIANALGYQYLQFTYEMLLRKEYEQVFEMAKKQP